jgi:hypothetical protein
MIISHEHQNRQRALSVIVLALSRLRRGFRPRHTNEHKATKNAKDSNHDN